MEWTFDQVRNVHLFQDAGTQLAKIFLRRSEKGKKKFRVKTLVSFLYFSSRRQKQLERSRKEWATTNRAFDSREDAQRYIDRKKKDVARFIQQREG